MCVDQTWQHRVPAGVEHGRPRRHRFGPKRHQLGDAPLMDDDTAFRPLRQDTLWIFDPKRGAHGAAITLTCAATTRQPCEVRTQVCICRPTWPGVESRWNRVEAVAKSRPKVVITVRDVVRTRPTGDRAARNAPISS